MNRTARDTAPPEHDGVPDAGTRSEREFARARRHSTVVRLLKVGLPAVALVLLVGAAATLWLARSLPGDFSLAATSVEDGRLVMEDPRMSGTDSNERPYLVIAQRAIQSLTGGGIDLEGIRAELAVDERTNATIAAPNGIYDPDTQTLRLSNQIAVDTTSGMTIRLSSADIDMGAGQLVGQGPVSITMPNQRLESGSITVSEGGSILSFGDRVRLTLLPNEAGDEPAPADPTDASPTSASPTSD